jgi:thymidylate synthase (FAD)
MASATIEDKVKLIWITPKAEEVISYCAKVSNPINQENKNNERLIRHCANNCHWSIFELSSMCVEINTTRAMSAQIIRHRSFSFQEFSQRYQVVDKLGSDIIERCSARRQDIENKQNSVDDLSSETKDWFNNAQEQVVTLSSKLYQEATEKGIAKESARFILPMGTRTRLYMSGTIRSWIHYLQVRDTKETQYEHRMIAREIKEIFRKEMPTIYSAIFDT